MDDRRTTHFLPSILLCLAMNILCGCSLLQKQSVNEVKKPGPPVGIEESEAGTSLNPFEKKKPQPTGSGTGVALANSIYANARSATQNPEKQFRGYDEARRIYEDVLRAEPGNLKAARGAAGAYIAMREFDRAGAALQKAIEIHPKEAILWADLSIVASMQNDFPTAITRLSKALEMDPQSQEIRKMLGVNLVFAGQVDRGVDMLARAGGKGTAHYQAARILERTGQPELARRHVLLALDSNPDYADARRLLAEMEDRSRPTARPNLAGPMNPPAGGSVGQVSLQLSADQ